MNLQETPKSPLNFWKRRQNQGKLRYLFILQLFPDDGHYHTLEKFAFPLGTWLLEAPTWHSGRSSQVTNILCLCGKKLSPHWAGTMQLNILPHINVSWDMVSTELGWGIQKLSITAFFKKKKQTRNSLGVFSFFFSKVWISKGEIKSVISDTSKA